LLFGIGSSSFHWILSILNEKSEFEVSASNRVYEVNVDTSFKILNNVKLCTLLDVLTLNTLISFEIEMILLKMGSQFTH
jgi:hypothetical protein